MIVKEREEAAAEFAAVMGWKYVPESRDELTYFITNGEDPEKLYLPNWMGIPFRDHLTFVGHVAEWLMCRGVVIEASFGYRFTVRFRRIDGCRHPETGGFGDASDLAWAAMIAAIQAKRECGVSLESMKEENHG